MKIPWRYLAFDKITVYSLLIGLIPPAFASCMFFSHISLLHLPKILLGFFLIAVFPATYLSCLFFRSYNFHNPFFWLIQFIIYYLIGKIIFIIVSLSKRKNTPSDKILLESSKPKTKNKAIIISIVTVILIVFGACCYILPLYIQYRMASPQKCVLKSPTSVKTAVFLRHGALMASRISFYLESEKKLLWVGTVEADDALVFEEACWSKDGTLIASKSRVTGYNEVPETDEPFIFTHAYDLKEEKSYVPESDTSDKSTEAWVKRAKIIEKLLLERGGEDNKVIKGDSEMAKVSWWQWRKYRDMEKK